VVGEVVQQAVDAGFVETQQRVELRVLALVEEFCRRERDALARQNPVDDEVAA
jgi:hypothetical protein